MFLKTVYKGVNYLFNSFFYAHIFSNSKPLHSAQVFVFLWLGCAKNVNQPLMIWNFMYEK